MKLLLGAISLFLIANPSFAKSTGIQTNQCIADSTVAGGDGIPWPWGNEIRFPWPRIQGVWAPINEKAECNSYFIFKKSTQEVDGEMFVEIIQYDPSNCQVISKGVGFESNRVIRASMTSGKKSFDLTIRAFDNSVLSGKNDDGIHAGPMSGLMTPMTEMTAPAKSVIVLTMYPKDRWERRTSYRMEKVRSNPEMICNGEF